MLESIQIKRTKELNTNAHENHCPGTFAAEPARHEYGHARSYTRPRSRFTSTGAYRRSAVQMPQSEFSVLRTAAVIYWPWRDACVCVWYAVLQMEQHHLFGETGFKCSRTETAKQHFVNSAVWTTDTNAFLNIVTLLWKIFTISYILYNILYSRYN